MVASHGPSLLLPWDILADDGLPEHCSSEDVPDGPVGRPPHLLELELLDPGLVGGDGRALDAHVVLLDRLCAVNSHLVVK